MPDAIQTGYVFQPSRTGALAQCEAERNDLLLEVDSTVHRMMLAFLQAGESAKVDIAKVIEDATMGADQRRARIRAEIARARAELEQAATPTPDATDAGSIESARQEAAWQASSLLEHTRQNEQAATHRLGQTQRDLADFEAEARRQLNTATSGLHQRTEIVFTGVATYPVAARIVIALQQDPLTTSAVPAHYEPGTVTVEMETVVEGLHERILQRLHGNVELVKDGPEAGTFRWISSPVDL